MSLPYSPHHPSTFSSLYFLLLLIILLLNLQPSHSYLQFKLTRIPHHSKQLNKKQIAEFKCPSTPQETKEIQNADFREVCYEKDVSYSFEIEREGYINYISADFTTPISWIKSYDKCVLENSTKKCDLIQRNFKETIEDYKREIKKKIHRHHKHGGEVDEDDSIEKAKIYGSSELISGEISQPEHLNFETVDSNRLTRLVDILMLGFYILGEKDILELESTRFINATEISPKLNYICDGAISLRFDENSENSFLNEIFDYTQAEEKIATIYLANGDGDSFLALGELSLKFSERGYSGISWVSVEQDEDFGKVPMLSGIVLEDAVDSHNKGGSIKQIDLGEDIPVVMTVSASYIGVSQEVMEKISQKLSKYTTCEFSEEGFMECHYTKYSDRDRDMRKSIGFSFGGDHKTHHSSATSVTVSIPFSSIILHEDAHNITLNIKQTQQSDFIILGEPLFQKYTMYFDYGKQRVGLAPKRDHFQKQFINVVSLIRFLVMIFTCGCCFILCSAPCRAICNHLLVVNRKRQQRGRGGFRKRQYGKDGVPLRQYDPIEENDGYEEVTNKVRSIANSSKGTTEVDGNPDDEI